MTATPTLTTPSPIPPPKTARVGRWVYVEQTKLFSREKRTETYASEQLFYPISVMVENLLNRYEAHAVKATAYLCGNTCSVTLLIDSPMPEVIAATSRSKTSPLRKIETALNIKLSKHFILFLQKKDQNEH